MKRIATLLSVLAVAAVLTAFGALTDWSVFQVQCQGAGDASVQVLSPTARTYLLCENASSSKVHVGPNSGVTSATAWPICNTDAGGNCSKSQFEITADVNDPVYCKSAGVRVDGGLKITCIKGTPR